MARMRYLKPEFWTDSKVVSVSPFARLLFQGTWNFSMCDHGHIEDDPVSLKLRVLPMDNVDVPALVEELIQVGLVVRRTTAAGRAFLHVKGLKGHQKTESRWTPRCWVCQEETSTNLSKPLPNSAELSETLPNSTAGGEGRGGESINGGGNHPPESPATRDDVDRICEHLADRVEGNGAKRPSITKKWRDSARLMLDRDGRAEAQVIAAIDWCQDDTFWRANILSMPKLREKYETLRLQAQGKGGKSAMNPAKKVNHRRSWMENM